MERRPRKGKRGFRPARKGQRRSSVSFLEITPPRHAENGADSSRTSMMMSIFHFFFTLRPAGRMTADHEPNQNLGRYRVGFNSVVDCRRQTAKEIERAQ